jgi:hypothetical protein
VIDKKDVERKEDMEIGSNKCDGPYNGAHNPCTEEGRESENAQQTHYRMNVLRLV